MLFEEQISRKPNKYPWTQDIIDALWQSHWTANEFNFRSDFGQFHTELTEQEQGVIVRTLSAIGQIEIAVKRFWGDLGKNLPHPCMMDMGFVMANNEVVHNQAYEKLLEVLQLNEAFEESLKEPVVIGRVQYLRKYLNKVYKDDRKQYIYALILFSLFVENVSLFGQFYIIRHFNRFQNVLKDTSQQVQYTRNEECYVDGTEVLTPQGWRLLQDMRVGDKIYQFTEDGKMELTTISHTVSKFYSGDLYSFKRKGNLCSVTENHDMIVHYADDKPGTFRRVKAKDAKAHKKSFYPRTAELTGGSVHNLSDLDRVRIAIQADGSNMYWVNTAGDKLPRGTDGGATHWVRLKKQRKITRLRGLLTKAGIKFVESKADKRGHVTFRIYLPTNIDLKTFDWVDLSDKSAQWCEGFVQELSHWDGWVNETGRTGYSSTVKKNIDVAQAIGMLAGYNSKVIHRVDNRSETYSDCWKVCFTKINPLPVSHALKKSVEHYSGPVHCVTVPSGMIMTRLNDDTFIAGNCLHAQAGITLINELRKEYPEYFDAELESRIAEECAAAIAYEGKVIEWILQGYEGEKLSAAVLKAYIKDRINQSMLAIGYPALPTTDEEKELKEVYVWADEELDGNMITDFFNKKPTSYAHGAHSFDADDMF